MFAGASARAKLLASPEQMLPLKVRQPKPNRFVMTFSFFYLSFPLKNFFMQIQRVKTVNELHDPLSVAAIKSGQSFGGVGSDLSTKDYFESNPVFYYCYRIFPFERGHGIFVANSIRRFLLYEIPTIAITSVLIHSKSASYFAESSLESGTKAAAESGSAQEVGYSSDRNAMAPPSKDQLQTKSNKNNEKANLGILNSSKSSLGKSSAAQMKKKKVTKKALKEQAAELFSYSLETFPPPLTENLETEEVSSLTEFTTIPFVRESFLEILLNLKACVFENIFAFDNPGHFQGSKDFDALPRQGEPNRVDQDSKVLKGKLILNASQEALNDPTEIPKELFFQTDFHNSDLSSPSKEMNGRQVREYKIWAKDLILPPGLKVRNPDLVLATLVAPKTNCELELNFEKIFQSDLTTLSMKTGRVPHRAEEKRRNVPIDGTLFPIKKVNFALSYTKFQKEIITFEIWTNGSLDPRQAIFQSVEKILTLFNSLREDQVKEIDPFKETAVDEFEEST